MGGVVVSELAAAFQDHSNWLRKAIALRVSPEHVDDVVQETFARLGGKSEVEPISSPRALLLTIAIGITRDQFRRKSVRDAARPQLVSTTSSHHAADQEELVFLKQLIGSLPPDCREIFILQRLYGLTYAQIARQTGLSLKAVEGRMTKALALCARKIAD